MLKEYKIKSDTEETIAISLMSYDIENTKHHI